MVSTHWIKQWCSLMHTLDKTLDPLVCYTAVFSVVKQCWVGALRDDTKNGCVADYGPTGSTKGKTRGDWIEKKLSLWPQSPLVFTSVFKNVLHWILYFLKAGKIFLASSHRTTLCKIGHRSESTLTFSNIFFLLFRLSETEEELLEQNNLGARGRCENRNMTGWLNGFNCGLRSIHPISTDILNYAILPTLHVI